ncbi:MAG TPA: metallophosphoesterase [Chloroflexia bacterium]|nr:metallophosphoesterase [Chloroflexia bacterium]
MASTGGTQGKYEQPDGTPGITVRGDFFKEWKEAGAEHGEWGYPITGHIETAGGEAVYFQRGLMWKGAASGGDVVLCRLHPPLLGRPRIANHDDAQPLLSELFRWHLQQNSLERIQENEPDLFARLWEGLALQKVVEEGTPAQVVSLRAGAITHTEVGDTNTEGITLVQDGELHPDSPALEDRSLYNLSLRLAGGELYPLAPHALYARRSWESFGFIHATDLHISSRVDHFKPRLRELGLEEGAEACANFNDGLRDMIRYANGLHDAGALDLVVMTGDLTDYMYEIGDDREGGGNFTFFERIIRGLAPSPEGVANPELRLPIFTVLGNHDYRPNSYDLLCDLDLGDTSKFDYFPDWLWSPERTKNIGAFGSFNLTQEEASALQGGKNPCLNMKDANDVVMVDSDKLAYYRQRINDMQSYVVELGPHRIVMLDSRWEEGIIKRSFESFLKVVSGQINEDSRNWLAQHPNLVGFDKEEVALVREALKGAGAEGIVVVGVHGPPLNPSGDEYAHYFRETEHPTADPAEVVGYLRRRDAFAFRHRGILPIPADVDEVYETWPRTGTPYFKRGGVGDLLDYGISKGSADEFLCLCAGEGASRPVDLVLCGHIHRNVEYRLQLDSGGEMLYYTDFYSENPPAYYNTVCNMDVQSNAGMLRKGDQIHIEVEENARPGEAVTPTQPGHGRLSVPPYATPLNSAADARAWWEERRPLVMQTAPLGPIDTNQRAHMPNASFQGFRVLSVEDNAISKIRYVTLTELRRDAVSLK